MPVPTHPPTHSEISRPEDTVPAKPLAERPAAPPAERDAARDAAIAKQRSENLEKDAKAQAQRAQEDHDNVVARSKAMADPKGMEREIAMAQARMADLSPAATNPNVFAAYREVGAREIARLRAHLSRLDGVVLGTGTAPGYQLEISALRAANDALDQAQAPKP